MPLPHKVLQAVSLPFHLSHGCLNARSFHSWLWHKTEHNRYKDNFKKHWIRETSRTSLARRLQMNLLLTFCHCWWAAVKVKYLELQFNRFQFQIWDVLHMPGPSLLYFTFCSHRDSTTESIQCTTHTHWSTENCS